MLDNTIFDRINDITARVLQNGETTPEEGCWLLQIDHDYLPWLMACADRIRKTFRGNEIEVCAISNVRSGNCSENCSFHHMVHCCKPR